MNEAVAIPGFDPFMATNDGCIFNGETGKKLTTQLDKKGYEKITFRLHGQKKTCLFIVSLHLRSSQTLTARRK